MPVVGILLVGSMFPNFGANTTMGNIDFYDWLGDSWVMLFTYSFDYTPVPLTVLSVAAKLDSQFKTRNVKFIALSSDSLDDHNEWIQDIESYSLVPVFPYPIISDNDLEVADKLGIIFEAGGNIMLLSNTVFIIGPDKKLKMSMYYPDTAGYNFDEILRVVDSLQLTAQKKAATPANWRKGGECIVPPIVSQDEIEELFPFYRFVDVPSGKNYMKVTPQP